MNGHGFADSDAVIRFLALRLVGKAGPNGRSSDALIASAAGGLAIGGASYPLDTADFGRCLEAFALAPPELQQRMLPTLTLWANYVEEKGSVA
jgi:hypothetical protein